MAGMGFLADAYDLFVINIVLLVSLITTEEAIMIFF